jgi:hypothetical protein
MKARFDDVWYDQDSFVSLWPGKKPGPMASAIGRERPPAPVCPTVHGTDWVQGNSSVYQGRRYGDLFLFRDVLGESPDAAFVFHGWWRAVEVDGPEVRAVAALLDLE